MLVSIIFLSSLIVGSSFFLRCHRSSSGIFALSRQSSVHGNGELDWGGNKLKIPITYEPYEVQRDFSYPDDEDDEQLESEMSMNLFNDLSGNKESLSVSDFTNWDDVKDLLEDPDGYVDNETIEIILQECGVKESMNYSQFLQVVELLNQVTQALEDSVDGCENGLEDDNSITDGN